MNYEIKRGLILEKIEDIESSAENRVLTSDEKEKLKKLYCELNELDWIEHCSEWMIPLDI